MGGGLKREVEIAAGVMEPEPVERLEIGCRVEREGEG